MSNKEVVYENGSYIVFIDREIGDYFVQNKQTGLIEYRDIALPTVKYKALGLHLALIKFDASGGTE